MAILSLSLGTGALICVSVGLLCSRIYFGVSSNRAFAIGSPDIDPPGWHLKIWGFLTLSFSPLLFFVCGSTEAWMATYLLASLAPLMLIPFPALLINALQWLLSLVCGNAQGDGSHKDPTGEASTRNGAPPIRWPPNKLMPDIWVALKQAWDSVGSWADMMWHGRTWTSKGLINRNHSLMCYLQSETLTEMHHLEQDVLQEFPSASPNSRANAVMMARCATLAYDRWHNVEHVINDKWNNQLSSAGESSPRKYEMLHAWTFDRVHVPSCMESQRAPVEDHSQQVKAESTRTAQYTPLPRRLLDIPETGRQDTGSKATWAAAVADDDGIAAASDDDEAIRTCVASGSIPADSPAGFSFHQAVAALAAYLSRLQQKVTDSKPRLRDRIFQHLKWVVWRFAGAGEPDAQLPDEKQYASLKTNAFLMRVSSDNRDPVTGAKVVALVLAFSGSGDDGLGSLASSLLEATQLLNISDPGEYPLGYTHKAFRDSLGLMPNLEPASGLEGFSCSYLDYRPGIVPGLDTSPLYRPDIVGSSGGFITSSWLSPTYQRGNPTRYTRVLQRPISPFRQLHEDIAMAIQETGPDVVVKVFVTGHSLGGALAHLFTGATLLSTLSYTSTMYKNFESLYTFGAPRVGDQIWVRKVEEVLKIAGRASTVDARFFRVVNAMDPVPRMPPTMGGTYQHPGHCVYIKPGFLISAPSKPAAALGSRSAAALGDRAAEAAAAATDVTNKAAAKAAGQDRTSTAAASHAHSHIARLTETPKFTVTSTAVFVTLKAVLSVLLLLSALLQLATSNMGTAAVVVATTTLFWPLILTFISCVALLTVPCATAMACLAIFWVFSEAGNQVITVLLNPLATNAAMLGKALVQHRDSCPRLASNPMYAMFRVVTLLGPGMIVLLLDMLLLPCIALVPILWWTVLVEPVLLLLMLVYMPPVLTGCWLDHSMGEYYTACWLSSNEDWGNIQESCKSRTLVEGAPAKPARLDKLFPRSSRACSSLRDASGSDSPVGPISPTPNRPAPPQHAPPLMSQGLVVADQAFWLALNGEDTAYPALNGMGADDNRALLLTPRLLAELQECSYETALLVADKLAEFGYYPLLGNEDGLIIGTGTFLKQLQSSKNEPALSAAYAASLHAASSPAASGPLTTTFAPHSTGQTTNYVAITASSSSSAAGSSGGHAPTNSQSGGSGGGGAGAGDNGGSDAGNSPPTPDPPGGPPSAGGSSSSICKNDDCEHRLTAAIPTGEGGVRCCPVGYGKSCTVNCYSKQKSSSEGNGKNSSVLGDGSEDRWDFHCQVMVDVCRHEGCEGTDQVFVKVHRARAECSMTIQPVPSKWYNKLWITGTDRCWCLSSTLFTFKLEALSSPSSVQTGASERTVNCRLNLADENMGLVGRLETPFIDRDILRGYWILKISPQLTIGTDSTGIQGVAAEQQKERKQLASQEKPIIVESLNLQPSGRAFPDDTATAETMELQRHVLNTVMCKERNTLERHLGVLHYESPPPVIYQCTRINHDDAVQLLVGMKLEAVYLRVPGNGKMELADPNVPAIRAEEVSRHYEKKVCLAYDVCRQDTLHKTAPGTTITVGTAAPPSPTIVTPVKLPPERQDHHSADQGLC